MIKKFYVVGQRHKVITVKCNVMHSIMISEVDCDGHLPQFASILETLCRVWVRIREGGGEKTKKQIVRALYTISITRILFSTENGERTDRNSTRWAINVHRQTHQTPLSYFIYKYLVRAFLLLFLSKSVSPLSLTLAFTEREICRDAER